MMKQVQDYLTLLAAKRNNTDKIEYVKKKKSLPIGQTSLCEPAFKGLEYQLLLSEYRFQALDCSI